MTLQRRTPAAPITLSGPGLFTAKPATITIGPDDHPASHASDAPGLKIRTAGDTFAVHARNLSGAVPHPAFAAIPPRCTTLAHAGPPVFTIEHALSALVGLGITDALIDIEGPEVPIIDGSAEPFAQALQAVGVRTLTQHATPVRPPRTVRVEHHDASVTIEPADAPSYSYTLDFGPDSPIAPATVAWDASPEAYLNHVAPARTFCLAQEAQQMQALGLFSGLTTQDMLVYGPDGPIDNAERFAHEPAAHKLLDLIGDLALVGAPLCARVTAIKSGHALHHKAALAILDAIEADAH
ncbi:MAG: UDP-3-O-acyl-N-acetylglucosamine deacetylase [Planctomycetota bacterium]